MKAIAALVTFIASSFTAWIGGIISAKIAAVIALVVVFSSIVAILIGSISAVTSGIEMMVSADLSRAMSWMVPSNTIQCIAAGMAAWVVRVTFDYHASIVRLWSSVL